MVYGALENKKPEISFDDQTYRQQQRHGGRFHRLGMKFVPGINDAAFETSHLDESLMHRFEDVFHLSQGRLECSHLGTNADTSATPYGFLAQLQCLCGLGPEL